MSESSQQERTESASPKRRREARERGQVPPLRAQLGHVMAQGLWLAAPLFGGLALLALGSTLLIGGWNFSTQAITPDLTRLNPATGIGRMFSSHSLIELVKGLAKF